MKNKGSQMFKMRQQRVEKFIYENNPDVFTSEGMVSDETHNIAFWKMMGSGFTVFD